MSKILVQTGYGYYKNQAGDVVVKAELPAGTHDLADGLVYVEVNSRAELDLVNVFQPPKSSEELQEEKIEAKKRQLAIDALIVEGNWP